MAVLRANVLTSPHTQAFLQSTVALSQIDTGLSANQLNNALPAGLGRARITTPPGGSLNQTLSWWDLFA